MGDELSKSKEDSLKSRYCVAIFIFFGAAFASGGLAAVTLTTADQTRSKLTHQQATPLTRASASRMTTAELAELMLGRARAGRITDHEIGEPTFSGGPLRSIRFFARPEPFGDDLCVRDTHYADLEPIGGSNAENLRLDVPVILDDVTDSKQIALAPKCRLKPKAFFAWAQSAPSLEEAAQALRRLAAFQRAARAGKRIPAVTCQAVAGGNDCRTPRADLARLQLDRIFIIEPLSDGERQGWEFSVMPEGPGHEPFWEVQVEEPLGQSAKIHLEWRIPAPF